MFSCRCEICSLIAKVGFLPPYRKSGILTDITILLLHLLLLTCNTGVFSNAAILSYKTGSIHQQANSEVEADTTGLIFFPGKNRQITGQGPIERPVHNPIE